VSRCTLVRYWLPRTVYVLDAPLRPLRKTRVRGSWWCMTPTSPGKPHVHARSLETLVPPDRGHAPGEPLLLACEVA
jgi:hypothetical protein